jgi:hypothetical protein
MDRLERLLSIYGSTRRKRVPREADEALTSAYVKLIFAYGFAWAGDAPRATGLREEARKQIAQNARRWFEHLAKLTGDTLRKGDPHPIHSYLVQAYGARIDQAVDRRPLTTPLPPRITAQLQSLSNFDRYKVDRLREVSKILEPDDSLDPIADYQHRSANRTPPKREHSLSPGVESVLAELGTPSQTDADRLLGGTNPNKLVERLIIQRAIASAWGRMQEEEAAKNLEWVAAQHLGRITDSYSTNTHFCRSVIQFMEPLVLATVGID